MNKNCKQCGSGFEVTDDDLKFYEKVSPVVGGKKLLIPPPTLCPDCRQQRRIAFRNERTLYKRNCDFCGKGMLSLYPSGTKFPVYCHKCWWGDDWDATDYGQDYDFSRSFFDQFLKLRDRVPRMNLYIYEDSENCDYINHGGKNKNCYLVFVCMLCEDIYYSDYCLSLKDSLDCFRVDSSELCYECVSSQGCMNLSYSKDCDTCTESYFLVNCKKCDHCIGCTNLKNKSYYIFNKKVLSEEYKDLQKKLEDYEYVQEFKNKFKKFALENTIFCENHNSGCENVVDCDYVNNSKNCYRCFDILYNCQDVKYGAISAAMTDAYDFYSTGVGNLAYETCGVGDIHSPMSNIYFSFCIFAPYNIYYCDVAHYCDNLFGCVGILRKKYCILNKQYTKEEFEKLVPKIAAQMQKMEEWGEFFPITMSPFPYNDTIAQDYYPLSKEEALGKGLEWADKSVEESTSDSEDIFSCTKCKRSFRIISQEKKFYQRHRIPTPKKCPDCRYYDRFVQRNPRKIWIRNCDKCGKEMRTSYSPERPEKVYCEECYLEAVE